MEQEGGMTKTTDCAVCDDVLTLAGCERMDCPQSAHLYPRATEEAMARTLREAYAALAFAFNRLHGSARVRDGELCRDFGKVRARIETVLKESGHAL